MNRYLKDPRIIALVVLVVVLAVLDYTHGLNFGIEFVGGTQIPVQLAQSVNPTQMNELIGILQQRLSTYGLKQVPVTGIGTSQVLVETASVSPTEINSLVSLIQSQGVFEGIVNGRQAINGSSLVDGSVASAPPTQVGTNVSWAVDFDLSQKAAVYFSKVVFGQANKPLYMFLDRPTSAILLFNTSLLTNSGIAASSQTELAAMHNAVAFGNRTIPIETINSQGTNWNSVSPFFNSSKGKYTEVILQNGTNSVIVSDLMAMNYTLVYQNASAMRPTFFYPFNSTFNKTVVVETWQAVGLLSSPILNPGVTNGTVGQAYVINGYAPANLSLQAKTNYANNQSKTITSILRGGALPVHVIVGTPSVTAPTLGASFERISAIALLLAVIAVALVIVIRYRKLFLIVPIMITTLAELFIMLSVVGLIGTIDLAAIAGMIAVIGTGVDAQIIITDELLSKRNEGSTMKLRLDNAFYIVWADAALLVVAMLPLFFSTSLVNVTGFSVSTIVGALLGAFLTRPVYGSILSKHYQLQV